VCLESHTALVLPDHRPLLGTSSAGLTALVPGSHQCGSSTGLSGDGDDEAQDVCLVASKPDGTA
jgi:hypothetical protein